MHNFFLIDDEKLCNSNIHKLRKNTSKKIELEDLANEKQGEISSEKCYLLTIYSAICKYFNERYEKTEKCDESYPQKEAKKMLKSFDEKKQSKINIKAIGKLSEHMKISELSNKVKEIVEKVKEFFSKDKGDIEKND